MKRKENSVDLWAPQIRRRAARQGSGGRYDTHGMAGEEEKRLPIYCSIWTMCFLIPRIPCLSDPRKPKEKR